MNLNSVYLWFVEKLVDKRRVAAILLMGLNAAIVILQKYVPDVDVPAEFAVQLSTLLTGIGFALWSKLAAMKEAAEREKEAAAKTLPPAASTQP